MTRPRPDLAAIIRSCYDAFLQRYGGGLTPEQRRALDDLAACRTAALGGHVLECPQCGHQQIGYNSCGNRHCPKCEGTAAARWLETQAADLLDVPYFHVVLTLPRIFNPIALANPREVYGLLMRAAAETLIEVAADPKHLGAEIGVLAVLHTWGQNLELHPHVHCVVPGGGLSPDGTRWVSSRPNFFLPVRVLSRVFRGKFLAGLRTACAAGRLRFPGKLASLADPDQFNRLVSEAVRTDWVVYTQPHMGSSEVVLKYLARYAHRAAISNHRLLELKDGQVRFRWKDYARGGRQRTMTLSAIEFVRRFLMHILPSGFVRIRHYGILANRHRKGKLARCRELLNGAGLPESEDREPSEPPRFAALVTPTQVCPICGAGRMIVIKEFPPLAPGQEAPEGADPCSIHDSS
jgi:hypothetical protein